MLMPPSLAQIDSAAAQPELLYGWQLSISWTEFVVYAFFVSVLTRAILSVVKMLATPKLRFSDAFVDRVNDRPNFQSGIIGFAEALAYPILLHQNQLTAIGIWLGLKTAGAWKGWTESPESRVVYLRLLIGNILVIAFSLVAAYNFIS